jgi:hypothetical protein
MECKGVGREQKGEQRIIIETFETFERFYFSD